MTSYTWEIKIHAASTSKTISLVASLDGPRNTTMMIMPMEYIHRTGSNITLSCSAASSPPAKIQWMVDGMSLNMFGPQLQLMGVKEKDSGNYQCLFHNTVTSRFATATAMIRIQGKIFFVIVSVDFVAPHIFFAFFFIRWALPCMS